MSKAAKPATSSENLDGILSNESGNVGPVKSGTNSEHVSSPNKRKKKRRAKGGRRRAHKVTEAPKSIFLGFLTSFGYGVFGVVWQRVLESLLKDGSRFTRGEHFRAVHSIRLLEQVHCENLDHNFLAVQTFKPKEFERFSATGKCVFRTIIIIFDA